MIFVLYLVVLPIILTTPLLIPVAIFKKRRSISLLHLIGGLSFGGISLYVGLLGILEYANIDVGGLGEGSLIYFLEENSLLYLTGFYTLYIAFSYISIKSKETHPSLVFLSIYGLFLILGVYASLGAMLISGFFI